MRQVKSIYRILYKVVYSDGVEYAGYLAYLTMLAIFPFLVLFMTIVGLIGREDLGELLSSIIMSSQWSGVIDALKPRIVEITSAPPQSLLTLAIISAIWTSSSIFEAIRTILNKIYSINETRHYFIRKLISVIELTTIIGIITTTLFLSIIIPNITHYISSLTNEYQLIQTIMHILKPDNYVLRYLLFNISGFAIVLYLYASIPSKKQSIKQSLPGTIFTTFSVAGATAGIKLYMTSFSSINIIYGSIGGVIISLLYFYICGFIFIIGASINDYLHDHAKKNVYSSKK